MWTEVALATFEQLRHALTTAHLLPDFSKEFVVETDASSLGIGAVLLQDGHPLAYISKSFSFHHRRLSAYERERLSILFALDKWKHYLMHKHFKIQIDHQPLKFMMDQKMHTTFQ